MRYVRLGKTEMQVSVLALGTWAFGGDWGSFDESEAKAAILAALDRGVTLFDTAQGYGFGVSERLLASALWQRVKREQVIVATKGGLRQDGDILLRDLSAKWLRRGVESSLRNLETDYIDLYQLHWPDPKTPAEETAGALEKMVGEGKIRHVGVSNFSPQQMDELARYGRVETDQPPYHMFRREIERDVLPYCAKHDIGVLAYGPLAHGLLSGRMTTKTAFARDDWRSKSSDFTGERFRRNLAVVTRLQQCADSRGITLPQLAVAWVISHPAVNVAIVGARRASQLDTTLPAAEVSLTGEDRKEIDTILADAVPVVGPSPEGM
ncbi:MAG: general stress protein [Acidobacteria bacterium]|nr:MAG: general stress protein [Acidobacteriota bacterium]